MEVEIFTIASYASNNNGRLTVVDTFDRILADVVPAKYPHCSVVVRYRIANKDAGEHHLEVRYICPGGAILASLQVRHVLHASMDSDYVARNTVIPISDMRLDYYGKYAFELYIDGEFASALSFYVQPKIVSVWKAA